MQGWSLISFSSTLEQPSIEWVMWLDMPKLRPKLIHWSLKYQGVERPNFLGLSSRLRFECGITISTLCLTPKRWMGSRVQSAIGYFPEYFFPLRRCLWGCESNLYRTLCFPRLPVLLVLIIIIIIIIINFQGRAYFSSPISYIKISTCIVSQNWMIMILFRGITKYFIGNKIFKQTPMRKSRAALRNKQNTPAANKHTHRNSSLCNDRVFMKYLSDSKCHLSGVALI